MLIQFKFGHFWLKIEQFWPFEEISIFSMAAILDQDGADGHNFERGPPKDHFWLRLAQ